MGKDSKTNGKPSDSYNVVPPSYKLVYEPQ